MIEEGTQAPSFDLPGVIGGRPGRVSLDRLLGESVVVLAFYPADFNPSCTDNSTDLDEFDVFRMQSDAAVIAISGDSLYSHRAFARKHDLQLPLLADIHSEVASAYGVESDDSRYANRRAVVVIDNGGRITYTWVAENLEERPDIEAVQAAFGAVDDADLAETQYREGYDRYEEGKEAFVSGMQAFEQHDWVLARSEFEAASESLDVASESFRRAVRFSEDEAMVGSFERGLRVVEELARAERLLSDAASAHASADSAQGERLREETETALTELEALGERPDPDALPVEIDTGETTDESTGESLGELDIAGSDGMDEIDDEIDEAELEALTEEIATQNPQKADTNSDARSDDHD